MKNKGKDLCVRDICVVDELKPYNNTKKGFAVSTKPLTFNVMSLNETFSLEDFTGFPSHSPQTRQC